MTVYSLAGRVHTRIGAVDPAAWAFLFCCDNWLREK